MKAMGKQMKKVQQILLSSKFYQFPQPKIKMIISPVQMVYNNNSIHFIITPGKKSENHYY